MKRFAFIAALILVSLYAGMMLASSKVEPFVQTGATTNQGIVVIQIPNQTVLDSFSAGGEAIQNNTNVALVKLQMFQDLANVASGKLVAASGQLVAVPTGTTPTPDAALLAVLAKYINSVTGPDGTTKLY